MNTYKVETLESTYRVYFIEAKDEETAEEILYEGDCDPAKQTVIEDEILEIKKMLNDEHSTKKRHTNGGTYFEEQ